MRTGDDVAAFAAAHGWPVVLKTPRGGYDGKGVFVVDDLAAAVELVDRAGPMLAEERVRLVRELAVVVARSPFGQAAVWPVVETVQRTASASR